MIKRPLLSIILLISAFIPPLLAGTPMEVCKTIQQQAKVNQQAVGILEQGATGFIISKDGLVLSACHVVENKKKKSYSFSTPDGTKHKLRLLGANRETDIAIFQIVDPPEHDLPFLTLSTDPVEIDDYCYAIGYPGLAKHAQLRVGMVRYFSSIGERHLVIAADAFIQPGDSGCPLFNAKGEVIGICSNIPDFLNTNRYATMDMFFRDKQVLLNLDGKTTGKKGSGILAPFSIKPTQHLIQSMTTEYKRRFNIGYRYARLEFLLNRGPLDTIQLLKHFNCETAAYLDNETVSLGSDDPLIHKQLPELPQTGYYPIPIRGKSPAYAFPCGDGIAVMRLDLWYEQATIKTNNARFLVKKLAELPRHNICLVSIPKQAIPFNWPKTAKGASMGDFLVAYLNPHESDWGVVTSNKKTHMQISPGHIHNKILLSKKSKLTAAIPHDIDLFAHDACVPIYTSDGALLGIHFHRQSRTIGYLIPTHTLQQHVAALKQQLKE